MASLTMDDMDELWTAMREDKSWRALRDILEYRPPDGVSRGLTDELVDATRKLQDRRFPSSKSDLYEMLRDELR